MISNRSPASLSACGAFNSARDCTLIFRSPHTARYDDWNGSQISLMVATNTRPAAIK